MATTAGGATTAQAPAPNPAAKAKFTFSTKLPLQIKPNYFVAASIDGEEDRVGQDLIKCCSVIENNSQLGGWDGIPVERNFNGQLQRAQQLLYSELAKDAVRVTDIQSQESKAEVEAPRSSSPLLSGENSRAGSPLGFKEEKSGGFAGEASVLSDSADVYSDLTDAPRTFLQNMIAVAEVCVLTSRLPPGKKLDKETFKVKQVATSWLYEERGWMFHIWSSPRGARNWVLAWGRLWKSLLDHRIEGIAAPFSVLFSVQGVYVTGTVLPPVVCRRTPEVLLPPNEGQPPNSFLAYMTDQLIHALGMAEGTQLTIYYGTDGRYYILNVADLLHPFRVQAHAGHFWRTELLDAMNTQQTFQCPPTQDSAMTFLKGTSIPQVIDTMVDNVITGIRKEAMRTPPNIFEGQFIRKAFKTHGVSVCMSYSVLTAIEERLNNEKNTWAANKKDVLKNCLATLKVDMVSRVIKQFARHDMKQQVMAGLDSEEELVDAFNRVAKLSTSANAPTFFKEHLLPALRKKFLTPDDFIITPKDAGAMLGLRAVAKKVGLLYDPQQQKFVKFTHSPIPTFAYIPQKNPAPRPDTVPKEARTKAVDEAWAVVDRCRELPKHSYTVRKNLLTARAIVTSLLHGDNRPRLDQVWQECLQEKGRGDGKSTQVDTEATWVEYERPRIAALHCEHAISRGRTDPEGTEELLEHHVHLIRELSQVPVDQPIAVLMMLRAATVRGVGGMEPAPNLYREAILELPLDSNKKWVSFYRSDVYVEALKKLEFQVPAMKKDTVATFHEVVNAISSEFGKNTAASLTVKYESRVMRSILVAPVAESHIDSHKLGVKLHGDCHDKYGSRDLRTIQNVYCLTMLALQSVTEVGLHNNIYTLFNRLLAELKHSKNESGDDMSAAVELVRDWETLDLLNRGRLAMESHRLEELDKAGISGEDREADPNAPETFLRTVVKILKAHLDALGDWYLALLAMQRCGRGFKARKDFQSSHKIWVQERKDVRAMEEARRKRLAANRVQVRKRLVDFFSARKIDKTDTEVDLMVTEAFEADTINAYFENLRKIHGELDHGDHNEVEDDEPIEEVQLVLEKAMTEVETPYDFDMQMKQANGIPTQEELHRETMMDPLYTAQLKQLFDTYDTDHDDEVTLMECYELLLPLKIMPREELHRMFLCGPERLATAKLGFEAWAKHVVDSQTFPECCPIPQ